MINLKANFIFFVFFAFHITVQIPAITPTIDTLGWQHLEVNTITVVFISLRTPGEPSGAPVTPWTPLWQMIDTLT